jgi:hypothetical protein
MGDDGNPAKGCLIAALIGLVCWVLLIVIVWKVVT